MEEGTLGTSPEVSDGAKKRFFDFAKSRSQEVAESDIPDSKKYEGVDNVNPEGQYVPVNRVKYKAYANPETGEIIDASIALVWAHTGPQGEEQEDVMYSMFMGDMDGRGFYAACSFVESTPEIGDQEVEAFVSRIEAAVSTTQTTSAS